MRKKLMVIYLHAAPWSIALTRQPPACLYAMRDSTRLPDMLCHRRRVAATMLYLMASVTRYAPICCLSRLCHIARVILPAVCLMLTMIYLLPLLLRGYAQPV